MREKSFPRDRTGMWVGGGGGGGGAKYNYLEVTHYETLLLLSLGSMEKPSSHLNILCLFRDVKTKSSDGWETGRKCSPSYFKLCLGLTLFLRTWRVMFKSDGLENCGWGSSFSFRGKRTFVFNIQNSRSIPWTLNLVIDEY